MIWSTIEASCPICARRVRLRELGGGFAQGQDSDLLVRMRGKHAIQVEIHTCHGCRFSGYPADFQRDFPSRLREHFRAEVSPALVARTPQALAGEPDQARTPLPDVQYYWAYRTAQAMGLPPLEQGERLVRAYWCLRLPPSASLPQDLLDELRRIYLRGAISRLRRGLRSARNRNLVYLVAELCRRNGNFLLSASYFQRFLVEETGARYLKQATRRLLDLARAKVSREMSLEEILLDSASDARSRQDLDG